eukprot:2053707-Rhodomonas_salina.3
MVVRYSQAGHHLVGMLDVDAQVVSQRVESEPRKASDIVIVGGVGHAEPGVCPNGVRERDHELDRHSVYVSSVSDLLAIAPSHIRLRVGVLPVHEAQAREVLQRLDEERVERHGLVAVLEACAQHDQPTRN